MTIEEFKQLKERDKVLYQGKICTVNWTIRLEAGFGANLKHDYEEVRPDHNYHAFWTEEFNHYLLIEQMIFISRANF